MKPEAKNNLIRKAKYKYKWYKSMIKLLRNQKMQKL